MPVDCSSIKIKNIQDWVITHKSSTGKMPVDYSQSKYTRLGNNSQVLYQQNASGLFPNHTTIILLLYICSTYLDTNTKGKHIFNFLHNNLYMLPIYPVNLALDTQHPAMSSPCYRNPLLCLAPLKKF